jgi:hypothetical protein
MGVGSMSGRMGMCQGPVGLVHGNGAKPAWVVESEWV